MSLELPTHFSFRSHGTNNLPVTGTKTGQLLAAKNSSHSRIVTELKNCGEMETAWSMQQHPSMESDSS